MISHNCKNSASCLTAGNLVFCRRRDVPSATLGAAAGLKFRGAGISRQAIRCSKPEVTEKNEEYQNVKMPKIRVVLSMAVDGGRYKPGRWAGKGEGKDGAARHRARSIPVASSGISPGLTSHSFSPPELFPHLLRLLIWVVPDGWFLTAFCHYNHSSSHNPHTDIHPSCQARSDLSSSADAHFSPSTITSKVFSA